MNKRKRLAPIFAALLAAGCSQAHAAAERPRYELACDSSDTEKQSALYCVRSDLQTGEVRLVELGTVPSAAGGPAQLTEQGAFQIVCDSTVTPARSEFHCLRLNRRTGKVERLVVPDLRRFPG